MKTEPRAPAPEPADTGKHGDMWTAEEDQIIDQGVRLQGLRWKAIAALLPGRRITTVAAGDVSLDWARIWLRRCSCIFITIAVAVQGHMPT